jgi:two-component system sensor histidine kinase AlgZ
MRDSHPITPDLCRLPVVLWLLLISELLAAVYVLSLGAISEFNWPLLALFSVYIQWINLLTLFGWCQIQRLGSCWPARWLIAASMIWVLLSVALCNSLAQWIYSGHRGVWSAQWLLRDELIAIPIAVVLQRHLYFMQRWRNEQHTAQRAQLDALQARLRPHFLFNTLNTIASLIRYAPDDAETAVEDLAVLLRKSLAGSEQLLPWRSELAVCRAYLSIEQLRLAERLRVKWQLEAIPDDLLLPSLSLQPLIENAVQHGIEHIPAGGTITVCAVVRDDQVVVSVSNPFKAANASVAGHHNGMALANIAARLASIYRNPDSGQPLAQLTFECANSLAEARLSIPYWRHSRGE